MKRNHSGRGRWVTAALATALAVGAGWSLAGCGDEQAVCPDTDPFCDGSAQAPRTPQEATCTADTECDPGDSCVNGSCVSPCQTNEDCDPGEACVMKNGADTGACQRAEPDVTFQDPGTIQPASTGGAEGEACSPSARCAKGLTCLGGTCRPPPRPSELIENPCEKDSDCGPDGVCRDGVCVLHEL